jgi:hypothetical protein
MEGGELGRQEEVWGREEDDDADDDDDDGNTPGRR